jgi:proteic killer suppression protein
MIQSFGDKDTESIFDNVHVRRYAMELQTAARRKLRMIDVAGRLDNLRVPPNNRLEKLRGDLEGFWSIRVNRQYRIVFRWQDADAYDVRLTDYH